MTPEYHDYILDRVNEHCPFNLANGIRGVSLEEGHAVVEAEIRPDHKNIWDTVHGGILFAAADVAAGLAVHSLHEGRHIVTAGSSINFLRTNPAAKLIRAEAEVIKKGRSLNIVQADIRDDQGNHLVTAQYTMFASDK